MLYKGFRAMNPLGLLLLALAWLAAPAAAGPELLDPAQAFQFSARPLGPDMIEVSYDIAPGYYLYRDKLKFSIDKGVATLGEPQLPASDYKTDKFFGNTAIYRGALRVLLPVTADAGSRLTLKAYSQGCADLGICYAPQTHRIELVLAGASVQPGAPAGVSPFTSSFAAPRAATGPGSPPAALPPGSEDETRLAALFRHGGWKLFASYFLMGIALAFTPCVLPMIPILSGILAPHGAKLTRMRGLALSAAYVLGMAMTYAAAGVAAALLGSMLSTTLQNPWVLGAFALMFVVLALSMFGLYELQLPPALQSWLASESNKLHGGHFAGVFTMGVLSALIVGPCVTAPLAASLLYISRSGDVLVGGGSLFALALGMGVPLLAVGVSSGSLLPRAGPWMNAVNKGFGVLLLGVAIYMVSPLMSVSLQMGLWGALLVVSAVALRALDALPPGASGWRKLWKGVGVLMLLAGAAYFIGALSGGRDVLHPLSGLRGNGPLIGTAAPPFRRVSSPAELDAALAGAGDRPVMLDFYADWCASCKEMERDTFTDPAVRERMDRMLLLQADVTDNLESHQALLKRYGLVGPPGILFFSRGAEMRKLRVIGYQPPEVFKGALDQAL